MECNAPEPDSPKGLLGKRSAQPVERIDLYAVDPHLPVQVSSGGSSRSSDQADHLSRLDGIANIHKDLRLVPEAAIYTPAMIDDRGIAADGQRCCKHDFAPRRGKDLQSFTPTKIQTAVETWHFNI